MSVDLLGLNRGYSRYILSVRLNGLAWLNNLATRLIASLSRLDSAQLWCVCGVARERRRGDRPPSHVWGDIDL
jgi:hypothetical protein